MTGERRSLPAEGFPLVGEADTTIDNLGLVGAGMEGVLRRQRKKAPGLFLSQRPLCQQRKRFHHGLALGSIPGPCKQNLNGFISQRGRKVLVG